jgi:hypothetical protein
LPRCDPSNPPALAGLLPEERLQTLAPPDRVYEHPRTGAMILLPSFPDDEKVYECHLIAVRGELDRK